MADCAGGRLGFAFPGFLSLQPSNEPTEPVGQSSAPSCGKDIDTARAQWEEDLAELDSGDDGDEAGAAQLCTDDTAGDRTVTDTDPGISINDGRVRDVRQRTHDGEPTLLTLPEAVLVKVVVLLPWNEVCGLSHVSHAVREVAVSESVWKAVYGKARTELLHLPQQGTQKAGTMTSQAIPGGQRLSYAGVRNRHGQHRVLEAKFRQLGGLLQEKIPKEEERGCCSRSLALARSMAVACSVGVRFESLRQTHDQVRCAMETFWADPELVDMDQTRRMVLKLTRFNWSLAYECLVGGFAHCTDSIAAAVRNHIRLSTANPICRTRLSCDSCPVVQSCGDRPSGATSAGPHSDAGHQGQQLEPAESSVGTACGCSTCLSWRRLDLGPAIGIWAHVLPLWSRYRRWLLGLLSVCGELNDLVSAERAAEYMVRGDRTDTPTLFDRGKAAFRSQVLLRFELRPALQMSLSLIQASRETNPDAASVLIDAWRLLLELNVADDTTEGEAYHMQERFCIAYGLMSSSCLDINRGRLTLPATPR